MMCRPWVAYQPIVMAVASMDTKALIHEQAHGVDAYSGLVAMMAAAQALAQVTSQLASAGVASAK